MHAADIQRDVSDVVAADLRLREFRALYRGHYGFVWSVVKRLGVRAEELDDAVQDAFLVAYRRWDDLRGDRAKPFLYGIARRVSGNYRRTSLRRSRKHTAFHWQVRPSLEPEHRASAADAVSRFIGSLSEDDRELFWLGEIEGLSGPELASALGVRESTAYGRLRRLRAEFRAMVGDDRVDGVRAGARLDPRDGPPRASRQAWLFLFPRLGSSMTVLHSATGWGTVGWGLAGVAVGGAVLGGAWAIGPTRGAVAPVEVAASAAVLPGPSARPASAAPPPAGDVHDVADPTTIDPRSSLGDATRAGVGPRSPARSGLALDSGAPSEVDRAPSVAEDVLLVRRASDALVRDDARGALALLDDHARRFADSKLGDLRVALRIEALCALGRRGDARDEARRFVERFPNSPAADRVWRACPSVRP